MSQDEDALLQHSVQLMLGKKIKMVQLKSAICLVNSPLQMNSPRCWTMNTHIQNVSSMNYKHIMFID